jgi:hypothetical protein
MRHPKCKECKGNTKLILSQLTDKVIGFLCDKGHYMPTAYGSQLLKGEIQSEDREYETD